MDNPKQNHQEGEVLDKKNESPVSFNNNAYKKITYELNGTPIDDPNRQFLQFKVRKMELDGIEKSGVVNNLVEIGNKIKALRDLSDERNALVAQSTSIQKTALEGEVIPADRKESNFVLRGQNNQDIEDAVLKEVKKPIDLDLTSSSETAQTYQGDYGNDPDFLRPINGNVEPIKEIITNLSEKSPETASVDEAEIDMYGRIEPTISEEIKTELSSLGNKRKLSQEEYEAQIEKWKIMINGTEKAVENVEKIIQDRRNNVFWRLKNLGLKNVTTEFRLKLRETFSGLKEKTKNLFGFSKKKETTSEGVNESLLLPEYNTQPGENLSNVIKEQVLSIPELNNLTPSQKEKVVKHLFEYAKLNPYMSMFDQVNKLSNQESIPSGQTIDLQMIKRLISYPVDYFGNKTIVEYVKNLKEN